MKSALEVITFLSPNYEPLYRNISARFSNTLNLPCHFRAGNELAEFAVEEADLVFACGWWYTRHPEKYEPLAAPVMENPRYRGLPVYYVELVTLLSHSVATIEELYGKVFGYNEENSFSGLQALLAELDRRKEDLNIFARIVKTGSHLNSIQALLQGEIDCATLDSTVLDLELKRRPEIKNKLAVTASFGPYPVPPLLVNKQLSQANREKISEILLNLPGSELKPYGIKEFREVNAQSYNVLTKLNHN